MDFDYGMHNKIYILSSEEMFFSCDTPEVVNLGTCKMCFSVLSFCHKNATADNENLLINILRLKQENNPDLDTAVYRHFKRCSKFLRTLMMHCSKYHLVLTSTHEPQSEKPCFMSIRKIIITIMMIKLIMTTYLT